MDLPYEAHRAVMTHSCPELPNPPIPEPIAAPIRVALASVTNQHL